MNVLLFGATGWVGQGVLRECLSDARIERIVAVGRSSTGIVHTKFQEILHADMQDFSAIESRLVGFDACFFCLGVSSFRMKEADYTRVTYDITLAAANVLSRLNPAMAFIYVTGLGTDGTERGRTMWARVKGRTENAILKLPFKAAYMFRPGFIQPTPGVRSKTWIYQFGYSITRPLVPLIRALFPSYVTSSRQIGQAMIALAAGKVPHGPIVENADINVIASDPVVTPAPSPT